MSAIQPIPGISSATAIGGVNPTSATQKTGGAANAFDKIVQEVDAAQTRADQTVVGLATGDVQDVHQVMIAMNEADLSFRMMLEVRNRLVDAYHEISRLQM